jgi:hypothetical protein
MRVSPVLPERRDDELHVEVRPKHLVSCLDGFARREPPLLTAAFRVADEG